MCGRYTLKTAASDLALAFGLEESGQIESLQKNYNVAPTQEIACVLGAEEDPVDRRFTMLRWGLVPSWAEDPAIGSRLINARSETAHEKPSFRGAFRKRRCLILADGFYEWEKTSQGKQPHYIRFQDGSPFAFAGLWERWKHEDGELLSCTILTTVANDLLGKIHNRMPVILPKENHATWLDTSLEDTDVLRELLVPYADEALECYQVDRRVNNPMHNDADCIIPLAN